eukprot:COSAG06_NODE_897_length_11651_cov_7.190439_10_plen_77_part_00
MIVLIWTVVGQNRFRTSASVTIEPACFANLSVSRISISSCALIVDSFIGQRANTHTTRQERNGTSLGDIVGTIAAQ